MVLSTQRLTFNPVNNQRERKKSGGSLPAPATPPAEVAERTPTLPRRRPPEEASPARPAALAPSSSPLAPSSSPPAPSSSEAGGPRPGRQGLVPGSASPPSGVAARSGVGTAGASPHPGRGGVCVWGGVFGVFL